MGNSEYVDCRFSYFEGCRLRERVEWQGTNIPVYESIKCEGVARRIKKDQLIGKGEEEILQILKELFHVEMKEKQFDQDPSKYGYYALDKDRNPISLNQIKPHDLSEIVLSYNHQGNLD